MKASQDSTQNKKNKIIKIKENTKTNIGQGKMPHPHTYNTQCPHWVKGHKAKEKKRKERKKKKVYNLALHVANQ